MVVKASVSFLTAHSDALLVIDVNTVVTSLTSNLYYLTPSPTLPVVSAANDAFQAAIAAAADGGKQLKWAKKMKRADLVALMRQLAAYVQMACEGDMTKLLSSGFPVQKPNRTPAPVPATPETPEIAQGLTGQALGVSRAVDGAYIYNWHVALEDAPGTVVLNVQSTRPRATFNGLTPGKAYLFKLNAVGTAGASDWSNAGVRMVI